MNIHIINGPRVIMESPGTAYPYFAWPSVARLKDGRIAVACSGFRRRHICPYGKSVMAFSDDDGETYCKPFPVIDTALDDRDAGLVPFGKSGLIFTSFNNAAAFQRAEALKLTDEAQRLAALAHIGGISETDERRDLGSNFRVSFDNGDSFGPLYRCPVTSPHGPLPLADGAVLWLGARFLGGLRPAEVTDPILCYTVDVHTGKTAYYSQLPPIVDGGEPLYSYEPAAIQLPDGRIVCHIRGEGPTARGHVYTTFQSVSSDNGKTWSVPQKLMGDRGGAPAHLMLHANGVLISAVGYRDRPYGVIVIFSKDGGESWSAPRTLYDNGGLTPDLGYPMSVERRDGSILTVFYCHMEKDAPAVIAQVIWRMES